MKNTISKKTSFAVLALLVMFLSNFSYAQNYENVIKADSTSWISYHRELEYTMKDLAFVKSINGTNYLYFSFGIDYFYTPYLVGTIREDNGRLWITYTEDPSNEILIMDMNLEVGDVFTFDSNNNIIGTVVEVRHDNGRKIIVFDRPSYNWYQEPIMFIEGVGRNMMTWEQYGDWDYNYQSCKFDNQELAYSTSNEHFRDCEYITDWIDEFSTDNQYIDVFPNPARTEVIVSINKTLKESYIINVFNYSGALVKTMYGNGEKTIIPINDMGNGVYFIKVIMQNHELYKELLINK